MFPALFRLSSQKEAMIAKVRGDQANSLWDLRFSRRLQDWEKDQLNTLYQLLSVVLLDASTDDSLQWKWSKDLTFSVKTVYST